MENRTGIRSILSLAYIYKLFGKLISKCDSHNRLVNDFIIRDKNKRILDVGCGPASILKYLPGHVQYVGIDYENSYIEDAKKVFNERGDFYCSDVNEIHKLKLEPFDLIYCGGLLHHLNDNEVLTLLSRLKNLLSKNGNILTFDGYYKNKQNLIARVLLNLDRGKNVRFAQASELLAKQFFSNVSV